MWSAIIAFGFFLLSLVFIWKMVIPRMVDRRTLVLIDDAISELENRERVRLEAFYEKEVVPVQEALRAYPSIIEAIHADLDLLFSEGQSKKLKFDPKLLVIDALDEPEVRLPKS